MSAYATALLESPKEAVVKEALAQKERAERAEAERDRLAAKLDEANGYNSGLRQRLVGTAANLAQAEADRDRLREFARSLAYCPCCGDHGPRHAEGCDHGDELIEAARAALADSEEK